MQIRDTLIRVRTRGQEPRPKRWVSAPDLSKASSGPREEGSRTGAEPGWPPKPGPGGAPKPGRAGPRDQAQVGPETRPGWAPRPGRWCSESTEQTDALSWLLGSIQGRPDSGHGRHRLGRCNPIAQGREIYFQIPLAPGEQALNIPPVTAGGRSPPQQLSRAGQMAAEAAQEPRSPKASATCGTIFT